jgi:hypothetical protein
VALTLYSFAVKSASSEKISHEEVTAQVCTTSHIQLMGYFNWRQINVLLAGYETTSSKSFGKSNAPNLTDPRSS